MNWDIVGANWSQFRGKVETRWGKLTDDHLDVIAGKRSQLAGKIQEVYGISLEAAEKQIRRFEQLSEQLHGDFMARQAPAQHNRAALYTANRPI